MKKLIIFCMKLRILINFCMEILTWSFFTWNFVFWSSMDFHAKIDHFLHEISYSDHFCMEILTWSFFYMKLRILINFCMEILTWSFFTWNFVFWSILAWKSLLDRFLHGTSYSDQVRISMKTLIIFGMKLRILINICLEILTISFFTWNFVFRPIFVWKFLLDRFLHETSYSDQVRITMQKLIIFYMKLRILIKFCMEILTWSFFTWNFDLHWNPYLIIFYMKLRSAWKSLLDHFLHETSICIKILTWSFFTWNFNLHGNPYLIIFYMKLCSHQLLHGNPSLIIFYMKLRILMNFAWKSLLDHFYMKLRFWSIFVEMIRFDVHMQCTKYAEHSL